jgi:hypothetical protein
VLSNSLNKTSLSCPMTPVVADYRARNLLILRVPATARVPIIGKSLGHKSLTATQIYARLNIDPVRAVVDKATDAMLLAANGPAGLLGNGNG